MQICEYFFENACYSVTKYYLCKQNNKRSLLGRKQRHQVVRSFPNRYLFSLINKVTSLFSISCILDIILTSKRVVSVFYECGNRFTKLIEVRCCQTNFANGWLLFNAEFSTLFNCCQTNFANGWLLFPYSIAALLWLILLCASCPLLCKCLCSWRLHDVRRCRNVEHLHWFRVRLPTLLLCHRLWLLLPN